MKATPLALAGLVGCGLTAFAARAQPAASETPQIRLSGDIEVSRLVDLAAARRGVRVVYEPQALAGRLAVRGVEVVDDAELWRLATYALSSRGLALAPTLDPGTWAVVKPAEAGTLGAVREGSLSPGGEPGADPGFDPGVGLSTVVVRPRHRGPRELAEVAKPLLTRGVGSTIAWPESGVLLVTDLGERLGPVLRLLEMADAPAADVAEIPVTQVSPQTMIGILEKVAAASGPGGGPRPAGQILPAPSGQSLLVVAPPEQVERWRALVERLDRREPAVTRTYPTLGVPPSDAARLVEETIAPTDEPERDRWRVVPDELTGALVVTATPERQARVAELMERLTQGREAGARPMRTFRVRNRPATELLASLNQLLGAGVLAAADAEPGAQRSFGLSSPLSVGSPPAPASAGREVTLTADESTNTLIAAGEPRALAQLAELVRTLDVRQPQVMLEVMLVSLSESQSRSLGVELERLDLFGDTRLRLSSLFGLSSGTPGQRTFGDSAGFTGVVLRPGDYSVLVRALKTVTEGRTMSLPRVLVNNNQRAQFSSTLQQPVADLNVGTNVSTTSFAGTQDAGTTVSIRPQIAEGDHLVLEYSLAISSFVGSPPAVGLPPPRQQNRVDSVATIPDGHTVVVGGLELSAEGKSVDEVPLAARIPILGELFKNRGRTSTASRFYVFIRPLVLRHETFEDLKHLSAKAVGGVAAAGGPALGDGFPTLRPRVVR